jgi:hypothetical protein
MESKEPFSKRFGHSSAKAKEITIREAAPDGLRGFMPMVFKSLPTCAKWFAGY